MIEVTPIAGLTRKLRVIAMLIGLIANTAVARPIVHEAKDLVAAGARQASAHPTMITGRAFVITLRGIVVYAARARVWLLPVTAMTSQWYENATTAGRSLPAGDPRMKQIARWTTTDENGEFEFTGLLAGDYYLVSELTPGVSTGYAMLEGGIFLYNRVGLTAGETQNVTLTAHQQPGVGFH